MLDDARACARSSPILHGQEGVAGSSPAEGSTRFPCSHAASGSPERPADVTDRPLGAKRRPAKNKANPPRRGAASAPTLQTAYHLAFFIAAGLVVAAIVVAVTVLEAEPRTAAEPADEEGEPVYA